MTGTFVQPDHSTQDGTTYKLAINNAIMVLARLAAAFAPHEQGTPDMTVRVDAGAIEVSGVVTEKAAQDTATIVAPVTNPRIDRVVIDAATGDVMVVEGTEAAVPDPPAIPAGKRPICQVALAITTAAIDNSLISDERVGPIVSGGAHAIIQDQRTNGTPGGIGVLSAWTARTLNTVVSDDNGIIAELASDKFKLNAGTYLIDIYAPFQGTRKTRLGLYNITDATYKYGTNYDFPYSAGLYTMAGDARLSTIITIAAQKQFEVRYKASLTTGSAQELGAEASQGDKEYYTTVHITKL